MRKIKNIIFDLDGTLWDSREQVVQSWKNALEKIKSISLNVEEVTLLMGKTNEEYKEKLFPNIDANTANQYMKMCEAEEVKYLNIHGATLFADAIITIKQLSKHYNLFIVSNCQDGYIESFLNHYQLNRFFKDIECNGRTSLNKTQNIELLISRNKIKTVNTCYVGDTIDDYEASKNNNLLFIYAKYGFGNCLNTEYTINNLKELPNVLENISFKS